MIFYPTEPIVVCMPPCRSDYDKTLEQLGKLRQIISDIVISSNTENGFLCEVTVQLLNNNSVRSLISDSCVNFQAKI